MELDSMDGQMKEKTEAKLVVQAQNGDREAFDKLVHRYRRDALTLAIHYTRDTHLAEDAVQDACIKAYTQLATLAHPDRFWNWFHKIVYNQLMMLLRRGGPNRHEQPLSTLSREDDEKELYNDRFLATPNVKGSNTDHVSSKLIRMESYSDIEKAMIQCLKPRDRIILTEHYLNETPLGELSQQHALTLSNTHQVISRARLRLRKHLIQSAIKDYIRTRNSKNLLSANEVGSIIYSGEFWSTAGLFLSWILQYTSKASTTLAEVMGLSGYAFQLCVNENIDLTSLYAYDWGKKFTYGLYNLGFQGWYIGGREQRNYASEQLVEAIHLIHQTVDKGVPALVWDGSLPHFAVVPSYEDDSASLTVLGLNGYNTISYTDLGKGQYGGLFVFTVGTPVHINRVTALKRTLEMALAHGQSRDNPMTGYAHGLSAYDTWIASLRGGRVDPCGNSFVAATAAEARSYAAEFFVRLSSHWLSPHPRRRRVERLCMLAANYYAEEAKSLKEVKRLFQFPACGYPNDPKFGNAAIEYLTKARRAESMGLRIVDHILQEL